MTRRRRSTLLILAAGFLALVVGLVLLQRIFAREHADALAATEARRAALTQYARAALQQSLVDRSRAADAAIAAAEADPLAPAAGLFLRRDGEVRLPRPESHARDTGARALYGTLLDPRVDLLAPADPDDPWAERLALRRRLISAVEARDRGATEAAFRALLAHRTRFVLAAEHDVPYLLALLTWFVERGDPDPTLLRLLLHDGVPDGAGGRLESLQRLLLRRRVAFDRADFDFLRDRVVALSHLARAPVEAFQARAEEASRAPVVPADLAAPALVEGGAWYLTVRGDEVRGVVVELPGMLAALTAEMRDLGLLSGADTLAVAPFERAPPAALPLAVESPAWAAARAAADRAYHLKTGLVVLCALLAAAIVALAVLGQRRKQRYLELKSDFVATVSHELRTPLASIRVMAETLERRLAGEPRARDYPARIVRDVDGLSLLVENILSFNRLDKGRWVARTGPVRPADVLRQVQDEVARDARRPVDWSVEGLDDLTLDADAELLHLLFANLARNGCQYNERTPIALAVRARRAGSGVEIDFADNGAGIPEEARRHVFTAFYRAPGSGRTRGSGLGTAICDRAMRLHDGHITLASTGPEGTTFKLAFPAARVL